jgi:hypothetical protein
MKHASLYSSIDQGGGSDANPAFRTAGRAPPLTVPIFFGLTLHCRRCRVFDLAPMVDPSGTVSRAESLRHNALATERAGMLEDHYAVAAEVLIEGDAVADVVKQLGERCLALLKRSRAEVGAVELEQIEST